VEKKELQKEVAARLTQKSSFARLLAKIEKKSVTAARETTKVTILNDMIEAASERKMPDGAGDRCCCLLKSLAGHGYKNRIFQ
jgi:hypothetical protein